MKVKDLIKILKQVPEEAEVIVVDKDYTHYPFYATSDPKGPVATIHITLGTPDGYFIDGQ